jgi:hypothetical protein
MTDDAAPGLDGIAEIKGEEPTGYRCASTPETQARWQLLRTKRKGATWQEGRRLYRMGPTGCTVYNPDRWS